MKTYDRINARKPDRIEDCHTFIVGGGIARLATTAFLTSDGFMSVIKSYIKIFLCYINEVSKSPFERGKTIENTR